MSEPKRKYRTVKIEVETCKRCKTTMARQFYLELGVRRYGSEGRCIDCEAALREATKKRRTALILGATVIKVNPSQAFYHDLMSIIVQKGTKTYEVGIFGTNLLISEMKPKGEEDDEAEEE